MRRRAIKVADNKNIKLITIIRLKLTYPIDCLKRITESEVIEARNAETLYCFCFDIGQHVVALV